jgi:Raf kinase inhibitor-like YbhB/YbcL family protein
MWRTAWMAGLWLAATTFATPDVSGAGPQPDKPSGGPGKSPAGQFTLSSSDIAQGKPIPERHVYNSFGCTGRNVSPALSWSNAPAGTKSFALLVHDPDAPTGHGWWHWIVYDIPADVTSLPADAGDPRKNLAPTGVVQARSDFGSPGYGGPCPPPGKPHRYFFRLYALNVPKLEAPQDATPALIGSAVDSKAIAKAELMGVYGR